MCIRDRVKGDGLTDADYVRNFEFKIQLTDEADTPLAGSYYFFGTDKVGYVQSGDVIPLHHDESITILGLPAGTRFTVTELGTSTVDHGRQKIDKFWVLPQSGVAEGIVEKSKTANGMFTCLLYTSQAVLDHRVEVFNYQYLLKAAHLFQHEIIRKRVRRADFYKRHIHAYLCHRFFCISICLSLIHILFPRVRARA